VLGLLSGWKDYSSSFLLFFLLEICLIGISLCGRELARFQQGKQATTNNQKQKQSAAVQVSSQHWKTHRRSLYHLSRVDPDLIIALSQNQMQGHNQFYIIYQEQLSSYANWRRLQYQCMRLFT